MTKSRLKKKWFLGIMLFIVAMGIVSSLVLDSIVKNILIKQVPEQTQGRYFLEIESLSCSIFQRKLHLFSTKLLPLSGQNIGSQAVFSIEIGELELAGVQIWRLIRNKELVINQVNILDPLIAIKRGIELDTLGNDNASGKKENIPFIQVNGFNIKNAHFTVIGHDSTNSIAASDASFSLQGFIYDPQSLSSPPFDFEDFSLSVKDYSMALPDSFYTLQASAVTATAESESITISGLELVPIYDIHQFMEKKGEQADRLNVFVKELKLQGLDFDRILEKELVASFVTIDSLNLVAYRDKRYILPSKKYVKFPQQALREFPHYVQVDSVLLHDAQITYRERVEGSEAPGHINFVNINALTTNVTNAPDQLKDSVAMITNATGYLMGAGKISAHIYIPIGDEQNVHYFEGNMSPMEMKVVNPMLKNIVFGEVLSGKVNELSFRAHLNEDESHGSMRFGYEDLKVQINHQESEKGRRGLITFVANTFIVKSDNPANGGFRESEMHYVRDKRKSLINFWWKTVLSGFKETMGIPEGNEKDKPEV